MFLLQPMQITTSRSRACFKRIEFTNSQRGHSISTSNLSRSNSTSIFHSSMTIGKASPVMQAWLGNLNAYSSLGLLGSHLAHLPHVLFSEGRRESFSSDPLQQHARMLILAPLLPRQLRFRRNEFTPKGFRQDGLREFVSAGLRCGHAL